MRYLKLLTATALLLVFGAAVACPGEQAGNQTQSGTVGKPLAPKPAA